MLSDGFMGSFDIDLTLRLSLQCINGTLVASAPTAAPTWAIYDNADDVSVQTGSLGSSDSDSKTGYRAGTVALTTANGFASGGEYRIRFTYAVSGVTFAVEKRFHIH